jgi:hypothetical protein
MGARRRLDCPARERRGEERREERAKKKRGEEFGAHITHVTLYAHTHSNPSLSSFETGDAKGEEEAVSEKRRREGER